MIKILAEDVYSCITSPPDIPSEAIDEEGRICVPGRVEGGVAVYGRRLLERSCQGTSAMLNLPFRRINLTITRRGNNYSGGIVIQTNRRGVPREWNRNVVPKLKAIYSKNFLELYEGGYILSRNVPQVALDISKKDGSGRGVLTIFTGCEGVKPIKLDRTEFPA